MPASLPGVLIRPPAEHDCQQLLAMNRESAHMHHPWIFPPTTEGHFEQLLERSRRDNERTFLVLETNGQRLAGVIQISNIVRGVFLNGVLSYYGSAPLAGRGYMQAGMQLVIGEAFVNLGLHRLEANIQPDNARSRALVASCGFRQEGFSPRMLRIAGQWRDHERWALLADEWLTMSTD